MGSSRQSSTVAAPVEKQFATESLCASPLFAERVVDLDEGNSESVPLGGTVTEVATKAALTASVDFTRQSYYEV